jgi:hypothetical protein
VDELAGAVDAAGGEDGGELSGTRSGRKRREGE